MCCRNKDWSTLRIRSRSAPGKLTVKGMARILTLRALAAIERGSFGLKQVKQEIFGGDCINLGSNMMIKYQRPSTELLIKRQTQQQVFRLHNTEQSSGCVTKLVHKQCYRHFRFKS